MNQARARTNSLGWGFGAKELLGGLDWLRRDGHPVTASYEPSLLATAE